MSDKTSKDMEDSSVSSEIDNLTAAESQSELEGVDNNEERGSKLMSDVLEAVNEMSADEAAQDSEGLQDSQDPVIHDLLSKKEEIDGLQRELAASNDKYLRSLADFENFKKRSIKERSDMMKYQGEQIVLDLVRVIDDLELAIQFSGQNAEGAAENPDLQKFIEGIKMIHKNFLDTLGKWQVRAESAVGEVFDPQKHMAISKVSVPDAVPGTVVSELKKLYYYKDKILRVAEVVVAAE